MCEQQSLRSAWAGKQSGQSLCLLLEYSMTVKLLTEHHLEFLSLKGCCTGSSESTLVKMSNCWKSHARAIFLSHDIITVYPCFSEEEDIAVGMAQLSNSIKIVVPEGMIVGVNPDNMQTVTWQYKVGCRFR